MILLNLYCINTHYLIDFTTVFLTEQRRRSNFSSKCTFLLVKCVCFKDNFRNDGRTCKDYRPMELETDVVTNANGSARLRLANTDILVGVKTEIDVPFPETPNQGKLEFFVDWCVLK